MGLASKASASTTAPTICRIAVVVGPAPSQTLSIGDSEFGVPIQPLEVIHHLVLIQLRSSPLAPLEVLGLQCQSEKRDEREIGGPSWKGSMG